MSVSPSKSGITIYECTCIICMEVFVEPIELPCKHELCRPCFDELRQSTLSKFECPQCRYALVDWYAAKRLNSSSDLVNTKRWLLIKQTFPDEVDMRLKGRSAEIVAESIKNYNQYGIVDSVYASVMSDFDLNRMLREEREETSSTTSPPRNHDSFDIHEFLRKEKEDEEKASMEAIAQLLREENNLSVNDYVDNYERFEFNYISKRFLTGFNIDRTYKPAPKTPKKARKTPQKRTRTSAPRLASAQRTRIIPESAVIEPIPQSPVILKTPTRSPNLDVIINAVASGQLGGRTTSTTRITSNTIVVTNSVGGSSRNTKRKLSQTSSSTSIEEIRTGPSSSDHNTNSDYPLAALREYSESTQKRIKITSSTSQTSN